MSKKIKTSCRRVTDCLYPNNNHVTVMVTNYDDGSWTVTDEGTAHDEIELFGHIDQTDEGHRIANIYGLWFDGKQFVAKGCSEDEWQMNAIVLVANASQRWVYEVMKE